MEIKTTKEIQEWIQQPIEPDKDMKWVSLKDILKFLDDFPSYHYSSMERDRQMADIVTSRMEEDIRRENEKND